MADRPTAYQLAADLWDRSGIPSFPVLLAQDEDGKWLKKPLVKWGGVTRDTHPSEFNWGGANAVGVPMGRRSGLFAFDVDSYKPPAALTMNGRVATSCRRRERTGPPRAAVI